MTSGCAALLPIGLGIQGAISAGSDVVSVVKWWEDRKFQDEANKALKAQAEEIARLREEITRTREELARSQQQLRDLLSRMLAPPPP